MNDTRRDNCSSLRNKRDDDAAPTVTPSQTPNTVKRTRITAGEMADLEGRGWSMPQPAHELETRWRHHHWQPTRSRIRRALLLAGTSYRNVEKFDACGAGARVFWSERDERYLTRASYCRSRHCQPCMKSKARLVAGNLRKRLAERPRGRYRFITATIVHTTRPLPDQIRHLLDSFKRLRNHVAWRSQHGGAYFFECKVGQDGRWHPHLHIVSEGAFIRREQLADAWHEVTGDSRVIDIRSISDYENVCHEVTKYVTKGTSRDVWDDDERAAEWIIACKGTRACSTFGNWRGLKLTEKPEPDWDAEYIATVVELVQRRAAGDRVAAAILTAIEPPGSTDHHNPLLFDSS
jgi:hypothetical protein